MGFRQPTLVSRSSRWSKVASGGETTGLLAPEDGAGPAGRRDADADLRRDRCRHRWGAMGSVVGRKLWELTARRQSHGAGHQVLCITHLPQLAGYGDSHFVVRKLVIDQRARTDVVDLRDESGGRACCHAGK